MLRRLWLNLHFILLAGCLSFIASEVECLINRHEILGEYASGNVKNSYYLKLERDGTFQFESYEDKLKQKQQGTYKFNRNSLTLVPETHSVANPSTISFLAFKWNGVVSFVPKKYIIEFCNELNQGNTGARYCLRKDQWLNNLSELPKIPEKWGRYLLNDVLRGRIVQIQGKQTAIVDIGMRNQLYPKMKLLTVTSEEITDSDSSVAYQHNIKAIQVLECFDDKSIVMPTDERTEFKVGQEVFSRLVLYKK